MIKMKKNTQIVARRICTVTLFVPALTFYVDGSVKIFFRDNQYYHNGKNGKTY